MGPVSLEFKHLRPVSELENEALREEIAKCLEKLDVLVVDKAKVLAEEDSLKDRLEELQKQIGWKGFRCGTLCFTATPVAGHRTLDRMMLIEAGVSTAIINSCMRDGAPSVRRSFKKLAENEAK